MWTSLSLADAGLKVCLLEQADKLGQATSAAAAGLLTPLQPERESQQILDWARLASPMWQEAQERAVALGAPSFEIDSGILRPASSDASKQANRSCGWRVQDIPSEQIPQMKMGDIRREAGENFEWSSASILHPSRALQSLALLLRSHKNISIQHAKVVEIGSAPKPWVRTQRDLYRADFVVVSTGCYGNDLTPGVSIKPMRGQMLVFTNTFPASQPNESEGQEDPPTQAWAFIDEDFYVIRRRDGLALVGSTTEDVGMDASTTVEAAEKIQRIATERWPQLRGRKPDYHWAGLRPAAPQPLVCELVGMPNFWLNNGHFRHGISSAPGAASALVSAMLREQEKVG